MSECRSFPTSGLSVSPVLTTVELLEPILLCLEMRCLLTSALRVCRQWRDVIQGSVLLQRALFFECGEEPSESHEVTFNPLLVELFPILFDFAGTPSPRGFNDLAIEALPIGQSRVAFYRRDASWRRMHLRQPPVNHVGLWTLDKIRLRNEKMKLIKYDGGLRMEGFYFLILKHVYWWDLFVKWGETQGQQLRLFQWVRMHMAGPAEEMVRTADVTIGGLADDYCVEEGGARTSVDGSGLLKMEMGRALANNDRVDEESVRKSVASNGLVKMGIFWFKVMEPDDGEVIWQKWDGPCRCRRH
ncbi:hypothetical protein N8I77_013209 [Diaporthe amygdali]|uniref:F-box domain-containing protein n=1 Tax=Phomopsis amygdali TaxID=1214568 RepID=A0AAD9S117_PHOAM|nr:hypothetical protein N8I77_013209 [Diaporthe amygdali]